MTCKVLKSSIPPALIVATVLAAVVLVYVLAVVLP